MIAFLPVLWTIFNSHGPHSIIKVGIIIWRATYILIPERIGATQHVPQIQTLCPPSDIPGPTSYEHAATCWMSVHRYVTTQHLTRNIQQSCCSPQEINDHIGWAIGWHDTSRRDRNLVESVSGQIYVLVPGYSLSSLQVFLVSLDV